MWLKSILKVENFYWNAGIFAGSIGTFLKAFKEHAPDIWKLKNELMEASSAAEIKTCYDKMPNISIDYCLMEPAKNVVTIGADFSWNDLGSWDAFDEVLPEKESNHILADCEYIEGAKNNIVYAPGKAVALIGLENYIVVHSENALMIMPKSESQKVKEIREKIKNSPGGEKFS